MAIRFRESSSTVAGHLNQMTEKLTVFSSTIMAVTKVNSELETLIVNDSALPKGFRAPDDPIISFELENFKQKVRETIISSRDVKNAVRSLAGYTSNKTQTEQLKEELGSQCHGDYHKLKDFLKIVGERISSCRKRSQRMRPKYEETHNLLLNSWEQQHPRSARTVTTTVTWHTWLKRGLVVAVPAVLINGFWIFYTQQMPSPTENPILPTTSHGIKPRSVVRLNLWAKLASLSNFSRMCIFGLLCLGFFCLVKFFKSYHHVTHQDVSVQPSTPNRDVIVRSSSSDEGVSVQPSTSDQDALVQPSAEDRDVTAGPTTPMSGTHTVGTAPHSVIMSISSFLETMKDHEDQMHDLEQCVRETVDCIDKDQDIGDIEIELDRLARKMELILSCVSD